jgi:hypothetical protein
MCCILCIKRKLPITIIAPSIAVSENVKKVPIETNIKVVIIKNFLLMNGLYLKTIGISRKARI